MYVKEDKIRQADRVRVSHINLIAETIILSLSSIPYNKIMFLSEVMSVRSLTITLILCPCLFFLFTICNALLF